MVLPSDVCLLSLLKTSLLVLCESVINHMDRFRRWKQTVPYPRFEQWKALCVAQYLPITKQVMNVISRKINCCVSLRLPAVKKMNHRKTQTSSFKLSLFIKAKLFIQSATRQIFQKVEITWVIFYFPCPIPHLPNLSWRCTENIPKEIYQVISWAGSWWFTIPPFSSLKVTFAEIFQRLIAWLDDTAINTLFGTHLNHVKWVFYHCLTAG